MTIQEALEVIKLSENWNHGQKRVSSAFTGVRTVEDDILDEKRRALKAAWSVIR